MTSAIPGASLGQQLLAVEAAVADLQRADAVDRIWRRDHTLWHPEPTEISDRLGWLTVSDIMRDQASILEDFGQEIKEAGFRHVVVLGMGGSSLGPEVLRQTFGSAAGYPKLMVLDSTVPDRILEVTHATDPAHTLFLVSSKSGGTVEPLSFYRYFRSRVEEAVGLEGAGTCFVAITDPGTPLEDLALEQGFRRVFRNPSDIGGRYSVLSYFGLVPAALVGLDIRELLARADLMREACASSVPAADNPGAGLGAVMGSLARRGRDKLTLVTSPALSSFGLWVEQLLAESTGKEGTGIVPVAGELLMEPGDYGDDRLFVYLRLGSDNNSATDEGLAHIESSGQPVVRLDLKDTYDLGAEFYRWEFATAVAGIVLGIHPFDQPNVQAAKDMTDRVLGEHLGTGRVPHLGDTGSIKELLSESQQGDYLAILAYLRQSPELDEVLDKLRSNVMQRYQIATTAGYGPRYLHSTGQLHKGGPGSGVFLQLTSHNERDFPVPGEPYTFGVLCYAQATGDLMALRSAGRRAASVHLRGDFAAAIAKLAAELA